MTSGTNSTTKMMMMMMRMGQRMDGQRLGDQVEGFAERATRVGNSGQEDGLQEWRSWWRWQPVSQECRP